MFPPHNYGQAFTAVMQSRLSSFEIAICTTFIILLLVDDILLTAGTDWQGCIYVEALIHLFKTPKLGFLCHSLSAFDLARFPQVFVLIQGFVWSVINNKYPYVDSSGSGTDKSDGEVPNKLEYPEEATS
jgi:hypothetical protein